MSKQRKEFCQYAARLLAQMTQPRRVYRFNDPRLLVVLGFLILVAGGCFTSPRLPESKTSQPSATLVSTTSHTVTPAPTRTVTATETLPPVPTSIPLTWKHIPLGQEFGRDTITAFAIDPKNPDVLYTSMENAGMYKSIDGGLSWHSALDGLTDIHVESLLVDRQDTQNVYAGTPSGIFKTEDGGENWSRIGEGRHVLIDPQNNAHLYARDADNIYESTDEGKNWTSVYSSQDGCPGKILSWAIHPADGNTLYLGGGDECEPGIYQSDDDGRTWTLIQKVEIPPGYEMERMEWLVGKMGWLLARLEEGNTVVDHGPPWETPDLVGFVYYRCWEPFLPFLCRSRPDSEQEVRLGKPDVWADVNSFESYVVDAAVVTVSPHDPDTIYVAGEGIAVTKDGGQTWTKLNNGLGSTMLHLEAGLNDAGALYLLSGDCQGIRLGQGKKEQWELKQSLYLSTNGGSTWDFVTQMGCHLIMDADGSTLYRLSTNYWWAGEARMGWLWRSQDGGRSWRRILIPPYIETIVSHPSQRGHLYGFGQDPFYQTSINPNFQEKWYFDSGDYGNTWKEQEPPASTKLCYGSTLQFIDAYRPMAIDPSDGNHVFVIDNGRLLESHNSCDTTSTFTTAPNTSMNSIAFDPNSTTTVYAGTDSGAYVSFDGGTTWNEINDGLLDTRVVYSIVVDRDSGVYAATPYGIFQLESSD